MRLASRVTSWLRRLVQKAQLDDPQWDEEQRRERTGRMGEDIRTEEEARSTDSLRSDRDTTRTDRRPT